MNLADEYFNRCKKISIKNPILYNKRVTYNVFSRSPGVVCGANKAVKYIQEHTYGPLEIVGCEDGNTFLQKEVVLRITGLFGELVNLETTYLGHLSFSGVATGMAEIVKEAGNIPVIDMSPRHFPPQLIPEIAYAAAIGGAKGTSTRAGYEYAKSFMGDTIEYKLYGSIPHALNAVCGGSSVEAAELYKERFPNIPLTVLIDFEGQELDVCTEAYKKFGDSLSAVRLDTHGGRYCQGTNKTKEIIKYYTGPGVTIEAACTVRKHLNKIGATKTRLIVSSGFSKEKVAAFVKENAPIDGIGTGSSWVKFMMFTSDIAEVEGRPMLKAGRCHSNLANNLMLYKR